MHNIEIIKNQFTPIQPSVASKNNEVSYKESSPSLVLSNSIHCYWQLKTNQSLDYTFFYRVIADGCIDIFWEVNNPHQSFIMGFSKSYTEFPLEKQFNYMGVRFYPTVFPLLFQTDASTLTDKFELLDVVIPQLSKQIFNLVEDIHSLERVKIKLDSEFEKLTKKSENEIDSRLLNAIDLILKNYGNLNLEKELDVGLSSRQLRRLFKFYIGDSPKSFCKIVRFQNLLKGKPSKESLKQNKSFYDFGYYDQPHFIKEFKHLYGISPNKALK